MDSLAMDSHGSLQGQTFIDYRQGLVYKPIKDSLQFLTSHGLSTNHSKIIVDFLSIHIRSSNKSINIKTANLFLKHTRFAWSMRGGTQASNDSLWIIPGNSFTYRGIRFGIQAGNRILDVWIPPLTIPLCRQYLSWATSCWGRASSPPGRTGPSWREPTSPSSPSPPSVRQRSLRRHLR